MSGRAGMSWALIGAVLCAGIYMAATAERQPRIDVAVQRSVGLSNLAVRNVGAPATFRAEIQVVTPSHHATYPAYWELGGRTAEIVTGMVGWINVADVGLERTHLWVYYAAQSGRKDSTLAGTITSTQQEFGRVTVRITSDPELKGGPFVRTYVVNAVGVVEATAKGDAD